MNLESRLSPSTDVVARDVGGETVLLDLASGSYFGLNPVGSRVWQLLVERQCTLAEACDVLLDEYEVGRQQLEADVLALAARLAEQSLVVPA